MYYQKKKKEGGGDDPTQLSENDLKKPVDLSKYKGFLKKDPAFAPKKDSPPLGLAEQRVSNDLKLIILGYFNCIDQNQVPPTKLQDIQKFISSDRPLNLSRYVVIWGVNLTTSPRNAVLAYEPEVPTNGGMVGFSDGSVRKITAEEFSKLPKASPTPSIADQPAAFTLTPTEYYAEFNKLKNMGGMAQKYGNKVIELKGIVKGLGRTSGDAEVLVISSGKPEEDVRCFVRDSDEPWAKLAKGQEVSVKGIVPSNRATP